MAAKLSFVSHETGSTIESDRDWDPAAQVMEVWDIRNRQLLEQSSPMNSSPCSDTSGAFAAFSLFAASYDWCRMVEIWADQLGNLPYIREFTRT
jgi:hypothetical protein